MDSNLIKGLLLCLSLSLSSIGQAQQGPVLKPGGSTGVLYSFPDSPSDISVGRNGENTFALAIPSFPAYLSPNLHAVYNSRGSDGVMGIGWSLAVPRISLNVEQHRQLIGKRALDDDYRYHDQIGDQVFISDRWVSNKVGDLVCEANEGNLRLHNLACFSNPHGPQKFTPHGSRYVEQWSAIDPYEGVTQYYGETDASRIQNDDKRVVTWLLEREVTQHGKEVRYFYEERKGSDQRLLRAVLVGGNKTIRFNYKPRTTNRFIDYTLSLRRQQEWLLDEIQLVDKCVPEQVIVDYYDIWTSFDDCSKSAVIEKIKLSYNDPSTRFSRRYALHQWQHMSGDGSIAYAPVRLEYNGDGIPSMGNGSVSSNLVTAQTPDFNLPNGSTMLSGSAHAPFQNYMDWNRDGLADWVSTKLDNTSHWPDPEKTDHQISVKTRNQYGTFDSPELYQEPLARYAAWLHLPETTDREEHFIYAEPLDSTDGVRVAVPTDERIDNRIRNIWPDATIGMRVDPWIHDPDDASKPPVFSSLSVAVSCKQLGEQQCRTLINSYKLAWDEPFDEEHDDMGFKITDLKDYNGDGYLDRVVSGLVVVWDPSAPDANQYGIRDPMTSLPAIYISYFDPQQNDFKPFERYSIEDPNGIFNFLNHGLVSALAVNVSVNEDTKPADMASNASPRAFVSALGLGLKTAHVVASFKPQNASSSSPSNGAHMGPNVSSGLGLVGLGLTATSLVANQAEASPDAVAALSYARLAHTGVTGSITAVEGLRAATATTGLSSTAGYAQFTGAITAVASQTINAVWLARSKQRMSSDGYVPQAIASNTKTGTGVVFIVAALIGIGVSIIIAAAWGFGALGPVGWVLGLIATLVGVVITFVGLFQSEGEFETADGRVKYDYRAERGISYRQFANVQARHQSKRYDIIDWVDIDGNGSLDLVASRFYARGNNYSYAYAAGDDLNRPVGRTSKWATWSFDARNTPKFLRMTDIDTEYEIRRVHRADQIDYTVGLLDINGDGLMDLLDSSSSNGTQYGFLAYLNTGQGFAAGTRFEVDTTFLPPGCSVSPKLSRSRSLSWTEFVNTQFGYSIGLNNMVQTLGPDLDNNGLPDLVIKDETNYNNVSQGGNCVIASGADMCDVSLPMHSEPRGAGASNCTTGHNNWYTTFDGFGTKDGVNEGESHLSITAQEIHSPTELGRHYVAFNTGEGFTKFVRIAQELPSFGGGFSAVTAANTSNGVPTVAVGGASNAVLDPDSDGQGILVAMDTTNRDIRELDGSHPVAHQFALGIKNSDALTRLHYPEGGIVDFTYDIKKDVKGEQGSPIWVLANATFDDRIKADFNTEHGWDNSKHSVNYLYDGAKWKDREYLGFGAIIENRLNGDNRTQLIQTYHQTGPERGTLACMEVRGEVIDNFSRSPSGKTETGICTTDSDVADSMGVDEPLSITQNKPVESSCLTNFSELVGNHRYPLLQRIENEYDTSNSSVAPDYDPDNLNAEITRVPLMSSVRTSTYNSTRNESWFNIDIEYDQAPYYTPVLSTASTRDGLRRSAVSEWQYKTQNNQWRFLKTAEIKRRSDDSVLMRTDNAFASSAPYVLETTTESGGGDSRVTRYENYNSGGLAEKITYPDITKFFTYYDDFEDGTGLLKSSTHLNDNYQNKVGKQRFTYDARGRVITQQNELGGISRFNFDALGNTVSDHLAGRSARQYRYYNTRDISFKRDRASLDSGQRTVRIDQIDGEQILNITWWDGFLRPYRVGKTTEGHQTIPIDYNSDKRIDETVDFRHDGEWFNNLNARYILKDTYFDAGGNSQCESLTYTDGTIPTAFNGTLSDPLERPVFFRDYDGYGYLNDYSVEQNGKIKRTIHEGITLTLTAELDDFGRSVKVNRAGVTENSSQYSVWDHLERTYDRDGNTRIYENNAWGQATAVCLGSQTNPDTSNLCPQDWATQNVIYDLAGRVIESRDFNGHITKYQYSNCGVGETIYPSNSSASSSQTGGRIKTHYDEACNVAETHHANGAKTTYAYDDANRIVRKTLGEGSSQKTTALMAYDELGSLRYVQNFDKHRTYYIKDFRGNTVETRVGRNSVATKSFNLLGYLESETTPLGISNSYVYDIMGRVQTRSWDTEVCDINALATGQFASAQATATERYQYDRRNRVSSFYSADGSRSVIEYTPLSKPRSVYPTSLTDRSAIDPLARTDYVYDEALNLTRVIAPNGVVRELAYDAKNRITSDIIVSSNGKRRITTLGRDIGGRLIQVTPPNDQSKNSCVVSDNPRDHEIRFSYTANNLLSREIGSADVNGVRDQTDYTYDETGLLKYISHSTGVSESFEYDVLAQLKSSENSLGQIMQWSYDKSGRYKSILDHRGGRTQAAYDLRGRLTREVDSRGFTSRYNYDKDSWLVSSGTGFSSNGNDWQGRKIKRDVAGQITRSSIASYSGSRAPKHADWTEQNSTRMCYDIAGRLQAEVDDKNQIKLYNYDHRGRLKSYSQPRGNSNGFRITHRFTYDNTNMPTRLRRLISNGQFEDQYYSYDDFGQISAFENSLTGERTTITYDDSGNVCEVRDHSRNGNDRFIANQYDAAGNLIESTNSDGQTNRFTYNQQGLLERVTDSTGYRRYEYNKQTQLSAHHDYIADLQQEFSFQYRYDANAELSDIVYPQIAGAAIGNTRLSIQRESRDSTINGLEWGGESIFSTGFIDGLGRSTNWQTDNDIQWNQTYDLAGRIINRRVGSNAGTLLEHNIQRDSEGNITAINDATDNRFDLNLVLDNRDRIKSESILGFGGISEYSWNDIDLLDSQLLANQTMHDFNYSSKGQLESIDIAGKLYSIEFDSFGQRTHDESKKMELSWNAVGLPSSVNSSKIQSSIEYAYDGRRIRSGDTYYVYGLGDDPVLEITADSSIQAAKYNLFVGEHLTATVDALTGEKRLFATDLQTSPVVEMNASGQLLAERSFNALGVQKNKNGRVRGQLSTDFGFHGSKELYGTGLSLMGRRVYDSATASFLSPDPLSKLTGESSYSFAKANSFKHHDRSGLNPVENSISSGDIPAGHDGPVHVYNAEPVFVEGTILAKPDYTLNDFMKAQQEGQLEAIAEEFGPLIDPQTYYDLGSGLTSAFNQSSLGMTLDGFGQAFEGGQLLLNGDIKAANAKLDSAAKTVAYSMTVQQAVDAKNIIVSVGSGVVGGVVNVVKGGHQSTMGMLYAPYIIMTGEPNDLKENAKWQVSGTIKVGKEAFMTWAGGKVLGGIGRLARGKPRPAGLVAPTPPVTRAPAATPVPTPARSYIPQRRAPMLPTIMAETPEAAARNLRSLGLRPNAAWKPSQPFILSGHGYHLWSDGFITVPRGVRLHIYNTYSSKMSNSLGNAVELGTAKPIKVLTEGMSVPNYSLENIQRSLVLGNPWVFRQRFRTGPHARSFINLDELLTPGMGDVHWASCCVVFE